MINPTRSDFIRENIHKGSPIVKTVEETQKLINEFYSNNTIETFEDLQQEREVVIKDTIEYSDGKNHQRAAKEILKVLNSPDRIVCYTFNFYREYIKERIKKVLSKSFFKGRWKNYSTPMDSKKYKDLYKGRIND